MGRRVYALDVDASGNGTIRSCDDESEVLAVVHGGNVLGDGSLPIAQLGDCRRLVTWSGTLGDELFGGHPTNWMPAGKAALMDRTRELGEALSANGAAWCVRPHARHVLSDVPSTRQFLADISAEAMKCPVEIALDPASMLEPMMLDALDEHIPRMFEALGPAAAMVMLSDAACDADGEQVVSARPGQGCVPGEMIRSLLDEYVPEATPIVLPGDSRDAHQQWVGV